MRFIRSFSLASVVAILCITLTVVPLTGCTVTPAQIMADGQAVATALNAIANLEAIANPELALNLKNAAQALQAATANWSTGSSVAIINDAAQVAEAILAAIPITSAIAPIVAIAVAALDVLIGSLPPSVPSVAMQQRMVRGNNPYRGIAHIHHRIGRSIEGDFKATWNEAVKSNALIPTTVIIK